MIAFLALLAASLQAVPQAAAAPAPAAAQPAAVAIPFDPPLGRTLRYRMTRTTVNEDGTVETGTGLTRRHRSVERASVGPADGAATQTDSRVLERIE